MSIPPKSTRGKLSFSKGSCSAVAWKTAPTAEASFTISASESTPKSFASGKFDVRVPVRGNDEIAELATTFNNMAQSLDNYETTRNTFVANVSHDLRTPMTTISGFIDSILVGAIPPEKHEYYLGVISTEIKRLSRLVTTLLDVSRLQAGEKAAYEYKIKFN